MPDGNPLPTAPLSVIPLSPLEYELSQTRAPQYIGRVAAWFCIVAGVIFSFSFLLATVGDIRDESFRPLRSILGRHATNLAQLAHVAGIGFSVSLCVAGITRSSRPWGKTLGLFSALGIAIVSALSILQWLDSPIQPQELLLVCAYLFTFPLIPLCPALLSRIMADQSMHSGHSDFRRPTLLLAVFISIFSLGQSAAGVFTIVWDLPVSLIGASQTSYALVGVTMCVSSMISLAGSILLAIGWRWLVYPSLILLILANVSYSLFNVFPWIQVFEELPVPWLVFVLRVLTGSASNICFLLMAITMTRLLRPRPA